MRILIVDDSTVYRSQIRAALGDQADLEVVSSAASGTHALEWLRNNSVDFVVLDMEMPEMSGLEFLREFRRRGHVSRVILFSAATAASADLALQALRPGADDVVTKPTLGPEDGSPAQSIQRQLLPKIRQCMAGSPAWGLPGVPAEPPIRRRVSQ